MYCEICEVELAGEAMARHEDDHFAHCESSLDLGSRNADECSLDIIAECKALTGKTFPVDEDEESEDYGQMLYDVSQDAESALSDAGYVACSDGNTWAVYWMPDWTCRECGRMYYSGEVDKVQAEASGWTCACGAKADQLVD